LAPKLKVRLKMYSFLLFVLLESGETYSYKHQCNLKSWLLDVGTTVKLGQFLLQTKYRYW